MHSQSSDSPQPESLSVPACLKSLEALQHFALSWAVRVDVSPALQSRIELVLEEVLVNVFHYAYPQEHPGMVTLQCLFRENALVFFVRDTGPAFNPLEKEAADISLDIDDRQIGGLGIYLIRAMVDSLTYERKSGANILTFSFRTDS